MANGDTEILKKPDFKPDVPAPLLHGKSESEVWMYEQQSIQRKQNDWIVTKLVEGDNKFRQQEADRALLRQEVTIISERVKVFEDLKLRMTGAKTVVALLLCSIGGPVLLAFLSAAFLRWCEKVWK
jgi:hypothetical protein